MQTRRKTKPNNEEGPSNSQRTLTTKVKNNENKPGADKEEIMNDFQRIQSAIPSSSVDISSDQDKNVSKNSN